MESKKTKILEKGMADACKQINENTSDSDIFLFVKSVQEESLRQGYDVSNIGELYWFLIRYRSSLSDTKKIANTKKIAK